MKDITENENTLRDLELLLLETGEISCETIDDALGEYVDGEFSDVVNARIEEHISACPGCKKGLELYREVIELAGTLREPEPEPALPDDVRERLRSSLNAKLGLNLKLNSRA